MKLQMRVMKENKNLNSLFHNRLGEQIMRLKRYSIIIIIVIAYLIICLSHASAQEGDLVPLLEKITARIESYTKDKNWKAMCITKESKMNKQWQPEETRTTKSIVKVLNDEQNQEILEAIELKEGKMKDITKEAVKQAEEEYEKIAAKEKDNNKEENSIISIFPFTKDKKGKYNFQKLDDAMLDGAPVFLIEAKAKKKDEKFLEGKYYIDQKTYDVLKIQVKPSKIPKLVDEIEMEMNFKMLPEGVLVFKNAKMKGSAGILGMHIRQFAEAEYSDFQILPKDAK
jgi:hypothetical protein